MEPGTIELLKWDVPLIGAVVTFLPVISAMIEFKKKFDKIENDSVVEQ